MRSNGKNTFVFGVLAALSSATFSQAQTLDLSWHTVDGGGGTFSTGGVFEIGGTIGQPDSGVLSGGIFEVSGGFWIRGSAAAPSCLRGDTNCSGGVDFFDIDPFLMALFDPTAYATLFCGGSMCTADASCDGMVDFFDIDPFLTCLFNGCASCAP